MAETHVCEIAFFKDHNILRLKNKLDLFIRFHVRTLKINTVKNFKCENSMSFSFFIQTSRMEFIFVFSHSYSHFSHANYVRYHKEENLVRNFNPLSTGQSKIGRRRPIKFGQPLRDYFSMDLYKYGIQNTKSAVADHVLSEEHSQPHEIDWQSVRILGRAQGTTERRMKEAMLIYQRHPKMNRDIGMERSSVWNSVL